MKDEYLILKRGEEGCIEAIKNAEMQIYMNQLILMSIKKRLLRVPKPKFKDDTKEKPKTGIG